MTRKNFNKDFLPSKIPKLLPIDMATMILKKPSRLELMKEEFQKKILKEKEKKIIELYENNKNRSLDRVRNHSPNKKINVLNNNKQDSTVRNFFEEGRALGERGNMAAIQAHYTRSYKSNSRRSSDPNTGGYLQKRSAGRDRAHPLAPIEKRKNEHLNQSQKPPYRGIDKSTPIDKPSAVKSYSAPNKSKPRKIDMNDNESLRSKSDSPPDLAQLANLKRKNSLGSNNSGDKTDKTQFVGVAVEEMTHLTDFQKWQLEQMRAKEERLFKKNQKNRKLNRSMSDESMDESAYLQEQQLIEQQLIIKQNELIAKINEEKKQLDKMKLEREKNQEKERREAEKREQRAVIEREKQQKLEKERKQEQARRKLEKQQREEERRAQEEERRQQEAERRAQEAEHRANEQRSRSHEEYEYEDERPQQHYAPRPPPQPRQNARRPPPRIRTPPTDGEELEKVDGPDINFYIQAAEQADGASTVRLTECRVCGRSFASERIQKHENACKSSNKKRKTFDPVKMRLEGTEAVKYVNSAKDTPVKAKKKDWRKQHEEFIKAISYAKKVTEMEKKGGDIRQITPPPPAENPDYVPCPHCGRKFNSTAAERHIPRCKDIKGKPARMR